MGRCFAKVVLGAAVASWAGAAAAQPAVPEYAGPTSGVVRLPWSDFRELLDRLRAMQEPEEAPPPVASVVGAATYRVTLDAEERQAKVEAQVELVVLQREGWVDVPLLPDTAALESFAVDGRSATLTQRDGFHRLIAQAGYAYYGTTTARSLTMTYRVNVERDGGPHGIALPLVEAGVTRLELVLPRADQEVRIEPGGVVLERVSGDAGTTITALVPRTTQAILHWSDRAAPVQEEPVRAVADVVHRVSYQRHVVSGEVTVALHVERGSFEAVVLRFPGEAEGIRATGDFAVDVVPEGEGSQVATVRAGYARREDTELVVRYELAQNVGQVSPPDVKVVKLIQAGADREIVRQAGFLVLHAAEGMEVAPRGSPAGAEPCDVGEVPGTTELTGQAVVAYRTSGLPYAVPLAVTRHEERAVLASAAQQAQLDLVVNREGKAVGDLVLGVQNNERQFLGVWLPRQAQLWATFVRGLPVKPSGENEWVMIPIPRSTIGPDGVPETIPVEVIYYQDVPRIEGLWGEGTFDFPRVDLLVYNYAVAVWVPEDFRYFGFEGDATPETESVGPSRVWVADNLSVDSGSTTRFAFQQNERDAWASARAPTLPAPSVEPQPAEFNLEDEEEQLRQTQQEIAAKIESSLGRENLAGLPVDLPEQPASGVDDGDRVSGARGRLDAGEDAKRSHDDRERDVHRTVTGESRGLLPIRVSVPRTGLMLRFTRSLVESKDGTEIGFRYQGRPVLATFPWLRWLAGLLLALGLGRLAHRSLLRRRFAVGVAAPALLVAGVALVVLLAAVLQAPIGGAFWALAAGLAVYAAVVAAVLLWRFLKQQRLPWQGAPPPAPGGPGPEVPPGAPPAGGVQGPAAPADPPVPSGGDQGAGAPPVSAAAGGGVSP
ncbi:MAG: hypothetical protein HY907_13215 [Deltaproteobacteria bacterium]|nr:hypothetical protein [Deltaproteobacteria bacterium]